jgi:hypothetical protein
MCQQINVRSPLADMCEQFREKARPRCVWTLLAPVNCLLGFIWKTRPSRDPKAVHPLYFVKASLSNAATTLNNLEQLSFLLRAERLWS